MATSKPRSRSLPRRAIKVVAVLFLLLVVTWFVFAGISWQRDRVVKYDLLADWNGSFSEDPPDQRSWPALRDSIMELSSRIPGTEPGPDVAFSGSWHAGRLQELGLHAGLHDGMTDPGSMEAATGDLEDSGVSSQGMTPEALRAWYLEQQAVLQRIRAGLERPHLGAFYELNPPSDPADRIFLLEPAERLAYEQTDWAREPVLFLSIELPLPLLSPLRNLSIFLVGDATLAASAGDGARAVADFRALHRLARQLNDRQMMIEQLVGSSILALAIQSERRLLTTYPQSFTNDDLETLARVLAASRADGIRLDLNGERDVFRELVQRLYSDDGQGDGVYMARHAAGLALLAQGTGGGLTAGVFGTVLEPVFGMLVLKRREAMELHGAYMDMLFQTATTPLHDIDWDQCDLMVTCVEPKSSGPLASVETFPVNLLASPPPDSIVHWHLLAAKEAANEVIVALLRYQRLEGVWPKTLEALVPEYLASVPLDCYDGTPLKYAVRDGRPLLWSVGANRTDESARVPAASAGNDAAARVFERPDALSQAAPGDWILWRGPNSR
ncbi:MAG: hypothetical protein P8J45_04900 [Phycisphaerales bacterium]|nr:hypothetical protein [Phycisphaerales bacterium]